MKFISEEGKEIFIDDLACPRCWLNSAQTEGGVHWLHLIQQLRGKDPKDLIEVWQCDVCDHRQTRVVSEWTQV